MNDNNGFNVFKIDLPPLTARIDLLVRNITHFPRAQEDNEKIALLGKPTGPQ